MACVGVLLVHGGSSGAGWTQLRWGGQQAPGTRSVMAGHRGEGADLGEGLAAAGKQETAAPQEIDFTTMIRMAEETFDAEQLPDDQ